MRVEPAEFLSLGLEAHALLRDVPLRDVSIVDLPGGGSGRTIADIRRLLNEARRRHPLHVRALGALRRFLGRIFAWDGQTAAPSYASRLTDDQRARSISPSGSVDGPLRLVYEFPNEAVGEIRNATVHAFVCMTLRPRASGYRFYFAVYVANVSRLTPLYMAVIEPFRRFLVYPALLGNLRTAWVAAYPEG
jgi:hypothetical protein